MLELVTGFVPQGEEDRSDEPVRFYAENQTWDKKTLKQLRDEYGVIFNGGIRAFMLIKRNNPLAANPLVAVGHEDDGILTFEKYCGHYSDCFSAYWIDSLIECLKETRKEVKRREAELK